MRCLKFGLEGLYFTSFRKPTSTSLIMSYTVPPYTTIRGLIANALGIERDNYLLQDEIKIGVKPISFLNRSIELAKILKLISRELKFECRVCHSKWTAKANPSKCSQCNSLDFFEIPNYKKKFSSGPMFKEFLIFPYYDIYIAGEDRKIDRIYDAFLQPARPLYVGTSDDFVDIEVSEPMEIKEVHTKKISGVAEGTHENCLIEKVPYKFIKDRKDFSLQYKIVSIPQSGIINLKETVSCWQFEGENIWLA